MHCRYLARDGHCTGKYDGYACIREHCSILQDAKKCEFHEESGDYCRKYARFGCVGRDNCDSLADYLESIAEVEHA